MDDIFLDRSSRVPLARQLAGALRDRIVSGAWGAGTPVPSSREWARTLGISRTLAVEALDQLAAEGFVEARRGSGTVVAAGASRPRTPGRAGPPAPVPGPLPLFRTGAPDPELFPREAWARSLALAARTLPRHRWEYGSPLGLRSLRRAVASWLGRSRGLVVDPERVAITSGATQALHLAVGLMAAEGRTAVVEDPCHTAVRDLLASYRLGVLPVAVDGQGMRTSDLPAVPGTFAYVTPAHQYPLGAILPASRRSALLDWADRTGAWVIEDDYDGEFRYEGPPVWPLVAWEPDRVVHVGSFSKTFAPAVRLGYALLPPSWVEPWSRARRLADVHPEVVGQGALADFLESGRLEGHLRAVRKVYAGRRAALLGALEESFGTGAQVMGAGAGLHAAVRFPGRDFRQGVPEVRPASDYALTEPTRTALADVLLFGYAHLDEEKIRRGVAALAESWNQAGQNR